MRKKLGETLVQAGLLSEEDLRTALSEHKRTGERLGIVLVRLNMATEHQIAKTLAHQLGFPYVNLPENPPELSVATLIPKDLAIKRACIAWRLEKFRHLFTDGKPLLTRESARVAHSRTQFDNTALLKALPYFTFTPLETVIQKSCAQYSEALKQGQLAV